MSTSISLIDLEVLRNRLLEPFRELEIPADVYDQTIPFYEYNDTERFRKHLLGRHWQEISGNGLGCIEWGILNDDATRYYTQAVIAGSYEEGMPGVDPESMFLLEADQTLKQIFSPMQLDSVSTYLWYYASFVNREYLAAYADRWACLHIEGGALRL